MKSNQMTVCKFLLAAFNRKLKKPYFLSKSFSRRIRVISIGGLTVFSSSAFCSTAIASPHIDNKIKNDTSNKAINKSIPVRYQYSGDHGLDFSQLSRGPLRIDSFSDGREGASPTAIISEQLAKDEPLSTFIFSQEIAAITQSAITNAFESGNAKLVKTGENLLLSGTLTTTEIKDDKLTLRVALQLSNNGKIVWENLLFSKVNINTSDNGITNSGIENALYKSLDKLIEELMYDDYFLLEILD